MPENRSLAPNSASGPLLFCGPDQLEEVTFRVAVVLRTCLAQAVFGEFERVLCLLGTEHRLGGRAGDLQISRHAGEQPVENVPGQRGVAALGQQPAAAEFVVVAPPALV